MVLSDETGKASQLVTGQSNISVRFIQQGHKDSSFNEDGTKKEKKATASAFVKLKEETKTDYRASKVGAAGSITCKPMTLKPSQSFELKADPTIYNVTFVLEKSQAKSNPCKAASIEPDG